MIKQRRYAEPVSMCRPVSVSEVIFNTQLYVLMRHRSITWRPMTLHFDYFQQGRRTQGAVARSQVLYIWRFTKKTVLLLSYVEFCID